MKMRKQYYFIIISTFIRFLIKLSAGYQIVHHVTFTIFNDAELLPLLRSGSVLLMRPHNTTLFTQEEERFPYRHHPGASHQGSGSLGPSSGPTLVFGFCRSPVRPSRLLSVYSASPSLRVLHHHPPDSPAHCGPGYRRSTKDNQNA